MCMCVSVSKRFSTLSDTQTPLLPIFPLAFIQVSFVHDLLYSFHPIFLPVFLVLSFGIHFKAILGNLASASLRYLHLEEGIFCRVGRLAWCNDPESYAGGSVATGRATLSGQVKGEHPDKERYTGFPGWELGRWASTSSPEKKKKNHIC